MILAVSNLAWAPEERLAAYDLMEAAGLTGLEIAPGLFFFGDEDPFDPDDATAAAALAEIESRGLSHRVDAIGKPWIELISPGAPHIFAAIAVPGNEGYGAHQRRPARIP